MENQTNETNQTETSINQVENDAQIKEKLLSQGMKAKSVCDVIGGLIILYGIIRIIMYFVNSVVYLRRDMLLTIGAFGCVIAVGIGVTKFGEWLLKVANE